MQWLNARTFGRVRGILPRAAREVLSTWETQQGAEGVPRVERVKSRRGKPSLQVLAADVARLYAVDVADVHQLAA